MTTVVIVDDQELVRTGLRTVLENQAGIAVLGEAADGLQAVSAAEALDPRRGADGRPDARDGRDHRHAPARRER
jgi:chemotaxis response regulator CheB